MGAHNTQFDGACMAKLLTKIFYHVHRRPGRHVLIVGQLPQHDAVVNLALRAPRPLTDVGQHHVRLFECAACVFVRRVKVNPIRVVLVRDVPLSAQLGFKLQKHCRRAIGVQLLRLVCVFLFVLQR
jgi:hypothetical protein